MKLEFRLSRGQEHSSDQPGRNFDARNFLRALSNQVTDPSAQAELLSLRDERDPELLGGALRNFAQRQESRGNTELAAAIYQNMAGAPESFGTDASRVAQHRLEVLRGGGNFGERVELFSQSFVRDVTDPATLAGMAFAGGVFQALRTLSYARLLASPATGVLTRGFGARALSFGLAFLAEAPAFSFATRATNGLLGREQDWSATRLKHELAGTYMMLGALRLSGAGGQALYRRWNPTGSGLLTQGFFQQTSMFAGITMATWLEQQTGLREPSSGAALLATSLASLIHFNAVGRVLHGLGGGEWTERLRLQQERMENLPPPRPEGAPAWNLPGRLEPALVGGDKLFMSSIDGTPSTPPPPIASTGETRAGGGRSSRPPPRDVRADLTEIESVLGHLFDHRPADNSWTEEVLRMSRTYTLALESLRSTEERGEQRDIHYLRDLSMESEIVSQLLTRAKDMNDPHFSGNEVLARSVIEELYRSSNVLINYLNNENTIPESLLFLRTARYWLQYGVEKSLGEAAAPEHRPDFPYGRGEDGYYVIQGEPLTTITPEGADPRRHVIVVGDERGPRTFELANEGFKVSHVEVDVSGMRITQRLMDMKVARAKDSGQWRATLPDGAHFHGRIQDAEPADVVEVHFPQIFDAFKPRSDDRRQEQLEEFITSNLTIRLKPGGTAFVMSKRHDAIEDLADALDRFPNLERLEFQLIRDRMPIRAGMQIASDPGNYLVSWLIFRDRGGQQ